MNLFTQNCIYKYFLLSCQLCSGNAYFVLLSLLNKAINDTISVFKVDSALGYSLNCGEH